ncbi:PEPxxWA-CTERM sorting domain-containing protein [Sphingomonas endolithica]|uniref:PEPxxWA-CTERM sorting domain-containing protein n=1 Tax=Sphingomonas endolithica TaxID=2972485 RepID=UPI0021AF72F7|nr:PEPxxWA-CTERM sorting domain-containing protein [Sphingomonas sp. ZFBP2030]
MKRILAAALAAAVLPTSAQAAIVININQVGTSIVATGSGSFDTTGLKTYSTNAQGGSFINAASGIVSVGDSAPISIFTGLSGPVLGYLQGPKFAALTAGDTFGLSQYLGAVYLPTNYQSNALLNGSSTYFNSTLASLGLTAGQYVYRSSADTVTLNIGAVAAAVPEPATWAMMLLGFGVIGFAMRRRVKASEVNFTNKVRAIAGA